MPNSTLVITTLKRKLPSSRYCVLHNFPLLSFPLLLSAIIKLHFAVMTLAVVVLK